MEECIAAIATPLAPAGLGIVRMSGKGAILIADKFFRPVKNKKLIDMNGYQATYGHLLCNQEIVDDGVALVFKAPNSYTGEDVVEISCHGGIAVVQKVLNMCYENGAKPAQNGEFTKRAFLNGKMTLTQAEAVVDLINAQSISAIKAANGVKRGVLYKKLKAVCDSIVVIDGQVQAWLDYPDEDIQGVDGLEVVLKLKKAISEIEALISSYKLGSMVKNGVKTVIVGKPNVGKSTIMNLLSESEQSIVTDISGTTRDVIEGVVQIDGVIFNLFDTAGIRDTEDVVEKIGVDRAKAKLEEADMVLFVADGSEKIFEDEFEILKLAPNIPKICVLNKSDLGVAVFDKNDECFDDVIVTSKSDESSIKKLREAMLSLTKLGFLDYSAPMIVNERQKNGLKKALTELNSAVEAIDGGFTWDVVGVLIEAAIDSLLELTGENACDKVIDEVFSKFCVGK